MDYKITRIRDDELYHWGKKKNHKYIARVKDKKGKWRYFYTRAEYQAYLKDPKSVDSIKGKTDPGSDNEKNKTLKSDDKTDAFIKKMSSFKLSGFASNTINRGKKKIDSLLTSIRNIPKNTKRYISRKGREFAEATLGLAVAGARKIPGALDKGVTVFKETAKKLYDDPDNIYDVTPRNYKKKIAKIKETKEWKDIVKRKDPEYVRKKEDGSTEYLIDDYLAKKKNPVLDVVDDIVSNRKITVNKITKDTAVAGVKEIAFRTVALGIFAVGAIGKFMIEKSKLYQGSYEDEMKDLKQRAERGAEYVAKYTEEPPKIKPSDVDAVMQIINQSAQVAQEVSKPANQKKAEEALSILTGSSNSSTTNDYQNATTTLTDLSEADIRYINELLKEQSIKRNQKSVVV